MGIHYLWQLLRPFEITSIKDIGEWAKIASAKNGAPQGSIVVDASIWIEQLRSTAGAQLFNRHYNNFNNHNNNSNNLGASATAAATTSFEQDQQSFQQALNNEIKSILGGFLRRTLKLLDHGVFPIFVFDGPTPPLKLLEVRRRQESRKRAHESTLKRMAEKLVEASHASGNLVFAKKTIGTTATNGNDGNNDDDDDDDGQQLIVSSSSPSVSSGDEVDDAKNVKPGQKQKATNEARMKALQNRRNRYQNLLVAKDGENGAFVKKIHENNKNHTARATASTLKMKSASSLEDASKGSMDSFFHRKVSKFGYHDATNAEQSFSNISSNHPLVMFSLPGASFMGAKSVLETSKKIEAHRFLNEDNPKNKKKPNGLECDDDDDGDDVVDAQIYSEELSSSTSSDNDQELEDDSDENETENNNDDDDDEILMYETVRRTQSCIDENSNNSNQTSAVVSARKKFTTSVSSASSSVRILSQNNELKTNGNEVEKIDEGPRSLFERDGSDILKEQHNTNGHQFVDEEDDGFENERRIEEKELLNAFRDTSRSNNPLLIRELAQLLDVLGIPYFVSFGEADVLCAALCQVGAAGGVLTEDSDAFAFGSVSVCRNSFAGEWQKPPSSAASKKKKHNSNNNVATNNNMIAQVPVANNNSHSLNANTLHCIFSSDLEQVGLTREVIISVALLAGSDYCPGIPKMGVAKFMEILSSYSDFYKNNNKDDATPQDSRLPEEKVLVPVQRWLCDVLIGIWKDKQHHQKSHQQQKAMTRNKNLPPLAAPNSKQKKLEENIAFEEIQSLTQIVGKKSKSQNDNTITNKYVKSVRRVVVNEDDDEIVDVDHASSAGNKAKRTTEIISLDDDDDDDDDDEISIVGTRLKSNKRAKSSSVTIVSKESNNKLDEEDKEEGEDDQALLVQKFLWRPSCLSKWKYDPVILSSPQLRELFLEKSVSRITRSILRVEAVDEYIHAAERCLTPNQIVWRVATEQCCFAKVRQFAIFNIGWGEQELRYTAAERVLRQLRERVLEKNKINSFFSKNSNKTTVNGFPQRRERVGRNQDVDEDPALVKWDKKLKNNHENNNNTHQRDQHRVNKSMLSLSRSGLSAFLVRFILASSNEQVFVDEKDDDEKAKNEKNCDDDDDGAINVDDDDQE